MKKILFLLTLVFIITFPVKSQIDISMGFSKFGINTYESSNLGLNVGISIKHFYCDFSGNMASGKGEELDFSSTSTYESNKVSIFAFNVGYNFIIKERTYITPIVGYVGSRIIYQDPIGWDTYFYGSSKPYVNIGISVKYFFTQHVGLLVGAGLVENYKVALSYKF